MYWDVDLQRAVDGAAEEEEEKEWHVSNSKAIPTRLCIGDLTQHLAALDVADDDGAEKRPEIAMRSFDHDAVAVPEDPTTPQSQASEQAADAREARRRAIESGGGTPMWAPNWDDGDDWGEIPSPKHGLLTPPQTKTPPPKSKPPGVAAAAAAAADDDLGGSAPAICSIEHLDMAGKLFEPTPGGSSSSSFKHYLFHANTPVTEWSDFTLGTFRREEAAFVVPEPLLAFHSSSPLFKWFEIQGVFGGFGITGIHSYHDKIAVHVVRSTSVPSEHADGPAEPSEVSYGPFESRKQHRRYLDLQCMPGIPIRTPFFNDVFPRVNRQLIPSVCLRNTRIVDETHDRKFLEFYISAVTAYTKFLCPYKIDGKIYDTMRDAKTELRRILVEAHRHDADTAPLLPWMKSVPQPDDEPDEHLFVAVLRVRILCNVEPFPDVRPDRSGRVRVALVLTRNPLEQVDDTEDRVLHVVELAWNEYDDTRSPGATVDAFSRDKDSRPMFRRYVVEGTERGVRTPIWPCYKGDGGFSERQQVDYVDARIAPPDWMVGKYTVQKAVGPHSGQGLALGASNIVSDMHEPIKKDSVKEMANNFWHMCMGQEFTKKWPYLKEDTAFLALGPSKKLGLHNSYARAIQGVDAPHTVDNVRGSAGQMTRWLVRTRPTTKALMRQERAIAEAAAAEAAAAEALAELDEATDNFFISEAERRAFQSPEDAK